MDGFDPSESVIIIAATNRPDVLDPALLRPGRFDRQVIVDLPDIKGRAEILKVHTKKLPISKGVSFNVIARGTSGFSGADLANLVNEAALLAARKEKKKIESEDFEEAKDKVTLGKARKSRVITEDDKKITAYHEIGHVLCAIFQEKASPVHKVTIIPRGFAAGVTHYLEEDDKHITKTFLQQLLVHALGGRAAEKIAFNEISTGASSDIQRVSDIAKKMVCSWGMSDAVGPMAVGTDDQLSFLGKQLTKTEVHSEDTAKLVDKEIRQIIKTAYDKALEILKNHRKLLDILSRELIKEETLLTDQLYDLIFANISEDERELVNKKFQKVKELKIDDVSDEEKENSELTEDNEDNNEKPADSEQNVENDTEKVNKTESASADTSETENTGKE
jgi:cell division protease FtsH